MLRRSELREQIFLLLFRADFYINEEIPDQIQSYLLQQNQIDENSKNYIFERVMKIVNEIEKIDIKINDVSTGWKTERMGKVDLSILRLAYYEMFYDDDIPVSVSINEAVELAKKYGTDDSYSFVNGILAKLV